MKRYMVQAEITISVTCIVRANSPEEAKKKADDCDVGSLEDCINNHRGGTEDVWLADELDGEPHTDKADVMEMDGSGVRP